jgi:uncharacterized phosphosugar-binding protein
MKAREYFRVVSDLLESMVETQTAQIERAAERCAAAIGEGHRIWLSQTTHCLHDEATGRAGGLIACHVLHDPITIEAGDVVLMGTNAGTTYRAVEIATIARERGASVVALTQLPYETDPEVLVFHPSGKRLHELADVVVDLGGHVGDGVFAFPEIDARVMPSSGVTGMMAMWMIFSQAVELLLAEGKVPLVYQSLQLPGAIARNERLVAEYGRTRRGYSGPEVIE